MSDKIIDDIKVESAPASPPTLSAVQFALDSDDSSDDDYSVAPVSVEASQKEQQMAKLAASFRILKYEAKLDKLEAYQNMAMNKLADLRFVSDTAYGKFMTAVKARDDLVAAAQSTEDRLLQVEHDVAQLRAQGAYQNDEKLALYYWEKDAAEVRVEAFEKRIQIVLASQEVDKMEQEYLEAATFLQEENSKHAHIELKMLRLGDKLQRAREVYDAKWAGETDTMPAVVDAQPISEVPIVELRPEVLDLDIAPAPAQEELETLKAKLAAAEKLAEELAKQLEQRSIASTSRHVSVSSIKESNQTENEELKRENEELKSRLDIQAHLYDVGYKTRGRRLNEVKSKAKFGHNQFLANSGTEVYRGFDSTVDATLFLANGFENGPSAQEYVDVYGVEPSTAWKYRHNSVFKSIITTNAEVLGCFGQRRNVTFNAAFTKLLDHMVTSEFKLNEDMIKADAELSTIHQEFQKEYQIEKDAYVKSGNFPVFRRSRINNAPSARSSNQPGNNAGTRPFMTRSSPPRVVTPPQLVDTFGRPLVLVPQRRYPRVVSPPSTSPPSTNGRRPSNDVPPHLRGSPPAVVNNSSPPAALNNSSPPPAVKVVLPPTEPVYQW